MVNGAETVKIGGVEYAQGTVARHEVKYREDGSKDFCVWLDNGVQLEYQEQKNAIVYTDGNNTTSIFRLKGATVIGNKEQTDIISAHETEDMIYDLNDNHADVVTTVNNDTRDLPSLNQLFLTDDKDSRQHKIYRNGDYSKPAEEAVFNGKNAKYKLDFES